jgi:hypothetical protein
VRATRIITRTPPSGPSAVTSGISRFGQSAKGVDLSIIRSGIEQPGNRAVHDRIRNSLRKLNLPGHSGVSGIELINCARCTSEIAAAARHRAAQRACAAFSRHQRRNSPEFPVCGILALTGPSIRAERRNRISAHRGTWPECLGGGAGTKTKRVFLAPIALGSIGAQTKTAVIRAANFSRPLAGPGASRHD